MSNVFFRVLLAGVLVLCVASVGILARSMTSSGGPGTNVDGRAPSVMSVRASVPGGHYGPGSAIGLSVVLDKAARGTLVAYLSSGVAVAMPCVAAVCKGDYWVGAGHSTDQLDVLFLSGSLTDAEGNRNDAPVVPAGANLSNGVKLKIGQASVKGASASRETTDTLPSM